MNDPCPVCGSTSWVSMLTEMDFTNIMCGDCHKTRGDE